MGVISMMSPSRQFDAIVVAQNADIRETVVFVRREQPSLLCRSHLMPPAGPVSLAGDRSIAFTHGDLIAHRYTHSAFLFSPHVVERRDREDCREPVNSASSACSAFNVV